MNASTTSKMIMWIAIACLFLASFPKRVDAGPVAFITCVGAAGGGICGAAVTVGN